MLSPNIETRAFFNERLAKHCGGDRGLAERAPIQAFVKAVLEIHELGEAERFVAGHIHWLRGKRPRTFQEALTIAKANLLYCFEEDMPQKDTKMWACVWEEVEAPPSIRQSPEEAFKTAAAVGEKIKAGKDPALVAALAKKALQKGTSPR